MDTEVAPLTKLWHLALMRHIFSFAPALLLAIATSASASSEELPPLPPSLLNTAGAVCIKVARSGSVTGAFIIVSTGDAQKDRDLVAWVQQLHWAQAEPEEKLRDTWFPMPIAIGNVKPPAMPDSCAPGSRT